MSENIKPHQGMAGIEELPANVMQAIREEVLARASGNGAEPAESMSTETIPFDENNPFTWVDRTVKITLKYVHPRAEWVDKVRINAVENQKIGQEKVIYISGTKDNSYNSPWFALARNIKSVTLIRD